MSFQAYWYAACQSKDLRTDKPLSVHILDEWLVLFRNEKGEVTAMRDRCLHRSVRLSEGRVEEGRLRCSYHGWLYNGTGEVAQIPSEGPSSLKGPCRKAPTFAVRELDDMVFVHLGEPKDEPFRSPHYQSRGFRTIRLVNRFHNNVTNCVENFIDVPHTTYVHPKIFRDPEGHRVTLQMERRDGSVRVEYKNEKHQLGLFAWFLGNSYSHIDSFHRPNVTCVEYHFAKDKHFYITSQSIPVSAKETLVYTDLTFKYGIFTRFCGWIVKRLGQAVIDQDLKILKNQMETIEKYPGAFQNSAADIVHVWIESIRDAIAAGKDPAALPLKQQSVDVFI